MVVIEIVKLVIGPLSGAALALIVNRLFEIRNKKPKMSFGIRYTHDVSPNSGGIKTNPSSYELFCLNISQVPVFIAKFLFYNRHPKKDYFLEIFPTPEQELSAILPFTTATFPLNNQEYDNIFHFCKEKDKYKCKVIAYSIDDKKYMGDIDLWWIETQDNFIP